MDIFTFCYVFVESAGGHGFEVDLRPDFGVFLEEVFFYYVLPDGNLLALVLPLRRWLGGVFGFTALFWLLRGRLGRIFGFDVDVASSSFIGFDLLLPDKVFEDVVVKEHVFFLLIFLLLSIAGFGFEELCFCGNPGDGFEEMGVEVVVEIVFAFIFFEGELVDLLLECENEFMERFLVAD